MVYYLEIMVDYQRHGVPNPWGFLFSPSANHPSPSIDKRYIFYTL